MLLRKTEGTSGVEARVRRGSRGSFAAISSKEVPLDTVASRRIGSLAAATAADDVVDGHVAVIAGDLDATIVTSDPDDLIVWGVDRERLILC